MAKRMQLGEAEFLFASNAAKFAQEMRMVGQALDEIQKEQARVTAGINAGTIAAQTGADQLAKLASVYNQLTRAQQSFSLAPMIDQASKAKIELASIAHTLDDLQYVGQMGLTPIINNLTQMSATVGLVALGAHQLYKNWDALVELMDGSTAIETEADEMERLAKATTLTADEAKRLADYRRDQAAGNRVAGMATSEEDAQQAAFDDVIKNMSREERDRLVEKIVQDDPEIRRSAEMEIDQQIAKEGPNWIKRQINDVGAGISALTGMAATTLMNKEERITIESLDRQREDERLEKERARQGMIDQRVLEMANQKLGSAASNPDSLARLAKLDPRFGAATPEGRAAAELIAEDEKENERRTQIAAKRRERQEKDDERRAKEEERAAKQQEQDLINEARQFKADSLEKAMNLVPGLDNSLTQMMAQGLMMGADPRAMREQMRGGVIQTLTDRGMDADAAGAAAVDILDRAGRSAEEKATDASLRGAEARQFRSQKIDLASFGDQILTLGSSDPEADARKKSYNAMISAASSLDRIEKDGIRARMTGGQR